MSVRDLIEKCIDEYGVGVCRESSPYKPFSDLDNYNKVLYRYDGDGSDSINEFDYEDAEVLLNPELSALHIPPSGDLLRKGELQDFFETLPPQLKGKYRFNRKGIVQGNVKELRQFVSDLRLQKEALEE